MSSSREKVQTYYFSQRYPQKSITERFQVRNNKQLKDSKDSIQYIPKTNKLLTGTISSQTRLQTAPLMLTRTTLLSQSNKQLTNISSRIFKRNQETFASPKSFKQEYKTHQRQQIGEIFNLYSIDKKEVTKGQFTASHLRKILKPKVHPDLCNDGLNYYLCSKNHSQAKPKIANYFLNSKGTKQSKIDSVERFLSLNRDTPDQLPRIKSMIRFLQNIKELQVKQQ